MAGFHETPKTATNSAPSERQLIRYGSVFFSKLELMCLIIWSSPSVIRATDVHSLGKEMKIVLGLIKCTRSDDKFLPPPDKVEELKAAFAAKGFTEEPSWYISLSD